MSNTVTNFDNDFFKELRERTLNFIKLDLTYLAAAGAIFAALKIGRTELFEIGAHLDGVLPWFLCLLGYDAGLDLFAFNETIRSRRGQAKISMQKLLTSLMLIQPFLHFVFLSFFLIFFTGYSQGRARARTQIEAQISMQEVVEQYVLQKGVVPDSYAAVEREIDLASKAYKKLNGEHFRIEATGPKSYKIIFAGPDGKFGTEDDSELLSGVNYREIFEKSEKDRNEK